MFAPVFGNIKVQNTGGNVTYTGSGNVGVWVAGYVPDRTKWVGTSLAPSIDLGDVYLQGDKNVGYYLAGNNDRPSANGIFQGNIMVNAKLGTNLDGGSGSSQIGTGNISGNDKAKSEDNVAIYISSGQRSEMNAVLNGYQQYFPATLGFTVNTVLTKSCWNCKWNRNWYIYLSADPIKNLAVSNFKIELGKYSKRGIGMIAMNGSVVDVNTGTTISDNAGTGADRAILWFMLKEYGIIQERSSVEEHMIKKHMVEERA